MSITQPPRGLLRLLARLPIWLYHLRLGWLLGQRFLMLTHIGRKSALPRYTVVEMVRYDKATDTHFIVSGYGEKSDWFRNICQTPQVAVCVGRRRFAAVAERVSPSGCRRAGVAERVSPSGCRRQRPRVNSRIMLNAIRLP